MTDCTQLETLDVTDVEVGITDQFLVDLCQYGLELRHVGLMLGPDISRDVIEALIETAPSLSSLSVRVPQGGRPGAAAEAGEHGQPLDENYFIKLIQRSRASPCYCDVIKQSASKTK